MGGMDHRYDQDCQPVCMPPPFRWWHLPLRQLSHQIRRPVPGPLPPLIRVQTMSGNGSKTTGEAIFDNSSTQTKTGVAHRFLEMALGIVDPDNLVDMPSGGQIQRSRRPVPLHWKLKITQTFHPTYSPNRQDCWFFENYVAAGYPSIIEIIPVQ